MNNSAAGVTARFALFDVLRQREVAFFGPSTPSQTRTPTWRKWDTDVGHFFRVKKTPQQTKKLTDSSGEGIREVQKERHTYHLPPAVPALSVSLTSIDAVKALCGRCAPASFRFSVHRVVVCMVRVVLYSLQCFTSSIRLERVSFRVEPMCLTSLLATNTVRLPKLTFVALPK